MDGIWREGDRIRTSGGMGYKDTVPDERLEVYASEEGGLHEYDRSFAAAVLAIRRFERASLGEPQPMGCFPEEPTTVDKD